LRNLRQARRSRRVPARKISRPLPDARRQRLGDGRGRLARAPIRARRMGAARLERLARGRARLRRVDDTRRRRAPLLLFLLGLAYIAVLLAASTLIFKRRNFK